MQERNPFGQSAQERQNAKVRSFRKALTKKKTCLHQHNLKTWISKNKNKKNQEEEKVIFRNSIDAGLRISPTPTPPQKKNKNKKKARKKTNPLKIKCTAKRKLCARKIRANFFFPAGKTWQPEMGVDNSPAGRPLHTKQKMTPVLYHASYSGKYNAEIAEELPGTVERLMEKMGTRRWGRIHSSLIGRRGWGRLHSSLIGHRG